MYSKVMFAKQFKSIIDSKGLTQRAVAEQMNTTEATISRYVSGNRTPNIETAVELARILGVSMNELVGVEPPAARHTPPDITILVNCYNIASDADKKVIWSLMDRYLSPEQRVVIQFIQKSEEKANVE